MSKKTGLDGRARDEDGEIRRKNGNAHLGKIEAQYGVDFGRRADMKLDNFLEEEGYSSLTEALKDYR